MHNEKLVDKIFKSPEKEIKALKKTRRKKNLTLMNEEVRLPKKISLLSLQSSSRKERKNFVLSGVSSLSSIRGEKTMSSPFKEEIFSCYNLRRKALSPTLSVRSNLKTRKSSKKKKEEETKYSKYNLQERLYKLSNEYSKVDSDQLDFLNRMDFYSLKYHFKDEALLNLASKQKPKITKEEEVKVLNRLISDTNRRYENKTNLLSLYTKNKGGTILNGIQTSGSRPMSPKKWNKIYKERIMKRFKKSREEISRLREEKRKEEEEKENKELKEIKKHNRVASKEKIEQITNRLYYKGISAKVLSEKSESASTSITKRKSRISKGSEKKQRKRVNSMGTMSYDFSSTHTSEKIEGIINAFFKSEKSLLINKM